MSVPCCGHAIQLCWQADFDENQQTAMSRTHARHAPAQCPRACARMRSATVGGALSLHASGPCACALRHIADCLHCRRPLKCHELPLGIDVGGRRALSRRDAAQERAVDCTKSAAQIRRWNHCARRGADVQSTHIAPGLARSAAPEQLANKTADRSVVVCRVDCAGCSMLYGYSYKLVGCMPHVA